MIRPLVVCALLAPALAHAAAPSFVDCHKNRNEKLSGSTDGLPCLTADRCLSGRCQRAECVGAEPIVCDGETCDPQLGCPSWSAPLPLPSPSPTPSPQPEPSPEPEIERAPQSEPRPSPPSEPRLAEDGPAAASVDGGAPIEGYTALAAPSANAPGAHVMGSSVTSGCSVAVYFGENLPAPLATVALWVTMYVRRRRFR